MQNPKEVVCKGVPLVPSIRHQILGVLSLCLEGLSRIRILGCNNSRRFGSLLEALEWTAARGNRWLRCSVGLHVGNVSWLGSLAEYASLPRFAFWDRLAACHGGRTRRGIFTTHHGIPHSIAYAVPGRQINISHSLTGSKLSMAQVMITGCCSNN